MMQKIKDNDVVMVRNPDTGQNTLGVVAMSMVAGDLDPVFRSCYTPNMHDNQRLLVVAGFDQMTQIIVTPNVTRKVCN